FNSPFSPFSFTLSLHDALPISRMFSYFDHLECSACFATYASTALMNLCTCGAPLLARYRLEEAAAALDRDQLEGQTLWRYHAMRSEEHTSELQSRFDLVCRLLL